MKFDELLRLIHFCKTIEREGTDPFDLDVKRFLDTLRRYSKKWKSFDDLLIDAEALAAVAKVIELQSKWIKDRASTFYIDPAVLELKLKVLEPPQLAQAFLQAWHPIISLDRLTVGRLKEALEYWNALLPLSARREEFPIPAEGILACDLEDLIALNLISRSEFEPLLAAMLTELERRGRTEYYEFIYEESYERSVIKSYLTSYLVSEGKAILELNPLEEKIFIVPHTAKDLSTQPTSSRSIPISISYEDWLEWQEKKKGEEEKEGKEEKE